MLPRIFPLAFSLAVLSSSLLAAPVDVTLTNDGAVIHGGTMGELVLSYPGLFGANHHEEGKILEKKPSGAETMVRYDNGAEVSGAVKPGGKLELRVAHLPAAVEQLEFNVLIPIAFNQGGGWKIGDKSDEFPKTKPAQPHLYQGHAASLELHNYAGGTLTMTAPEYAFLQLTDNREWNWATFDWHIFVPVGGRTEFTFAFDMNAPAGKAQALVDEFGQSAREDWPGKVKSLEELKGDVEAEKKYMASFQPPPVDRFGGRPGTDEALALKKTGFFHVQKSGLRWLLVDPDGNAFFHLGFCGVVPGEDYTLVKGRESAFAWLPPRDGEFATAYKPGSDGSIISFQLANQIRKYGAPYDPETYLSRMIDRMHQWGFNSLGAFTIEGAHPQPVPIPYVAHLPLAEWEGIPRLPNVGETFDPFDEKTRATAAANMAKALPARANDPLLIGYFIVNEPIYENIHHMVPSLNGSYACKRRFVQWLQEKRGTIAAFNAAWGLKADSFDALNDQALAVSTDEARADVNAFTGVFLEEYFRFIEENFRKYDPNHLLIGCRLQPGTINNEQLCRIAGQHVDVMSFNYYTDGVDKGFLRRIYQWTGGKPMMLSEFFWGAPQGGLTGGREVASQEERGIAYRNYVEQSASLGFVIGIEWFTLNDQAVTGRWFQGFDGERANTGAISVADRPWRPLVEAMAKTNYEIYDVWLKGKPPYAATLPRFQNKE